MRPVRPLPGITRVGTMASSATRFLVEESVVSAAAAVATVSVVISVEPFFDEPWKG
jgi:hypothetical protein